MDVMAFELPVEGVVLVSVGNPCRLERVKQAWFAESILDHEIERVSRPELRGPEIVPISQILKS